MAELGYISIEELKELNVELDFHFESKTLQDVKIDLMAKQHGFGIVVIVLNNLSTISVNSYSDSSTSLQMTDCCCLLKKGLISLSLSGSFVVVRKIEDECGFFIFEIGKFNKRIYENSVLIKFALRQSVHCAGIDQ
jgi:hypothetical protein